MIENDVVEFVRTESKTVGITAWVALALAYAISLSETYGIRNRIACAYDDGTVIRIDFRECDSHLA